MIDHYKDSKAPLAARRRPKVSSRDRSVIGPRTGFTSCATVLAAWYCALLALPAAAQAADESESGLAEVLVTAQHIEETVQTTPIAISVYGGDALKTVGIDNLAGLSAVAPDMNFATTEGQSIITIRGISSWDTTEIGDPAVSVDTDGFYMNRPYGLDADLYDIDRIEVLRGPQGTLNGRNSVGGSINIITAQPVDQLQGYTSVQYGDYSDLELQGMLNVPLTDHVQVRAAFLSASHAGYRDNYPEPPGDSQDDKSARIELAFEPAANLKGLLTAQYTNEGGSGDVTQYIPFVYTSTGALDHDLPAGIDSSRFPLGTDPFLRMTSGEYRAQLVYDFDAIKITALGGYDHTAYAQGIDQTLYPNAPTGVYQWVPSQSPNTVNAEVRIASRNPGRFRWQVGGFYFSETSSLLSSDVSQGADGGDDLYFGFMYHTPSRSKAGYAQASYRVTSKLTFTGGYRYTADYKASYGYYGDLSAGIIYANQAGSASFSKSTYHAEADYELTSINMLYAKFDTGYKAGGFNFGASAYAPETVKAFEVGSKNRFLRNTLQLNVAAFDDDYTDQQVATYAFLATGQPVQLTENAGASRNYGVETDLLYRIPVIGLLNLSADYLHARYTYFLSVADPSDPTASGNVQLAGNQPPQAPAWSFGMGLEHSWEVNGGSLTGRIQSKAETSSYFSFYNFGDTRQKGYTMSDAFLTYETGDSHWKVTAFVRNLENSVVFKDAEESEYAEAYAYEFYPPRTFGGRLEYSW